MATSIDKSLEDLGRKHVTKGLGRLTEGIMSKGQGSYMHFEDGRKLLDFTCGIGVTGLGDYMNFFEISESQLSHIIVFRTLSSES